MHRPLHLLGALALLAGSVIASASPASADDAEAAVESSVVPTCNGRPADLVGTPGPDHLVQTTPGQVIVGLGGDDIIEANINLATVCGGAGNDTISNTDGWLSGGPGDDTITSNSAWVQAGAGNDTVTIRGGYVVGGPGNDRLTARDSADMDGGDGDDTMNGSRGGTLNGGKGQDTMFILLGTAHGGAGNDTVESYSGQVTGGADNDVVTSTYGSADGGPGSDVVTSRNAFGGPGNDYLEVPYRGGSQADTASGGSGDDWLKGHANATLYGDGGNDVLDTGRVCDGGAGTDQALNCLEVISVP